MRQKAIVIEKIGRQAAAETSGLIAHLMRIFNECHEISGIIGYYSETEIISMLSSGKILLINRTATTDRVRTIGLVMTSDENRANETGSFLIAFDKGVKDELMTESLKALKNYAYDSKSHTLITIKLAKQGILESLEGLNSFLGESGFKLEGFLQNALKTPDGFITAWYCSAALNGRTFEPIITGLMAKNVSEEALNGLKNETSGLKRTLQEKTDAEEKYKATVAELSTSIEGLKKSLQKESTDHVETKSELFLLKEKMAKLNSGDRTTTLAVQKQKIDELEEIITRLSDDNKKLKLLIDEKDQQISDLTNTVNQIDIAAKPKQRNTKSHEKEMSVLKTVIRNGDKGTLQREMYGGNTGYNQNDISVAVKGLVKKGLVENKPEGKASRVFPIIEEIKKQFSELLDATQNVTADSEMINNDQKINADIHEKAIIAEGKKENGNKNGEQTNKSDKKIEHAEKTVTESDILTEKTITLFHEKIEQETTKTDNTLENRKVIEIAETIIQLFIKSKWTTFKMREMTDKDLRGEYNISLVEKAVKLLEKANMAIISEDGYHITSNIRNPVSHNSSNKTIVTVGTDTSAYGIVVSELRKINPEKGINGEKFCKEVSNQGVISNEAAKAVLHNLDKQQRIKYVVQANTLNKLMDSMIAFK